MNKLPIIFLALIFLTGCGKEEKVEEKKEQTATIVVTEERTEEVYKGELIASGSGQDTETPVIQEVEIPIATSTEAITEEEDMLFLPDVIEPLDNDDKFNPRITNASCMRSGDYDRGLLFDAILSYMYLHDIKDTCTEIHVDERDSQGTSGYKLTLKFENHEDCEVVAFRYDGEFGITPYIDFEEVWSTSE